MKYVSLVVDNNTNATDELYTYISEFSDIKVGNKVSIPFSRSNRITDGYVVSVSDEKPEGINSFKKIRTIDPDFSLSSEQIETAIWMHQRYISLLQSFLIHSFQCLMHAQQYTVHLEILSFQC